MSPEFVETIERCSGSDPDGSGVECSFFQLTPEWGIKVYQFPEIRDGALEGQRIAHEAGFAPEPGEAFDLPGFEALRMGMPTPMEYGYLTRVAEVGELEPGEAADLVKAMEKEGFGVWDLHRKNTGYYEGRPVCIDFDPVNGTAHQSVMM